MQGYFCKSVCLCVALVMAFCLSTTALAADSCSAGTSVYCFGESEFTDEEVSGIFVLSVPDQSIGKICCGDRVIRSGDVLTRDAMTALTLKTCCADDAQAVMTYLPIYGKQLGDDARLTINIRSGKAGIPVAKNLKLETYKNIANDGILQATDEGGGELTFSVETQPKLGTVELSEGGKFVYTPQKNKVGSDSFTYTATDADGNTSEPATVSIEILKPVEQTTYSDLADSDAAFEAAWMQETGIYSGSHVGSETCFYPDAIVSRGEFLVMAMQLLEAEPADSGLKSGFADEADAPAWMQPYLASAMRHGYINGFRSDAGLVFCPNDPITYASASVILQNMMHLNTTGATEVFAEDSAVPAWAQSAVSVMREHELPVSAADCTSPLTRAQTASLLYSVSQIDA